MNEEIFFNQNKDITENDLIEIKNEIKKGFDSTEDFLTYVFLLKILDSTININISDEHINDIKEQIEIFPPIPYSDEYVNLFSAIATIKIINPKLKLETSALWTKAIESLSELKTSKNSRNIEVLTSLVFYMKIIDPSFNVNEVIGDDGWKSITESFYDLKNTRTLNFDNFNYAAKIKVLNSKIDLDIGEDDWKFMREQLLKSKEEKNYGGVNGFVSLAATMKILSASKAIITTNGLEII